MHPGRLGRGADVSTSAMETKPPSAACRAFAFDLALPMRSRGTLVILIPESLGVCIYCGPGSAGTLDSAPMCNVAVV